MKHIRSSASKTRSSRFDAALRWVVQLFAGEPAPLTRSEKKERIKGLKQKNDNLKP